MLTITIHFTISYNYIVCLFLLVCLKYDHTFILITHKKIIKLVFRVFIAGCVLLCVYCGSFYYFRIFITVWATMLTAKYVQIVLLYCNMLM